MSVSSCLLSKESGREWGTEEEGKEREGDAIKLGALIAGMQIPEKGLKTSDKKCRPLSLYVQEF